MAFPFSLRGFVVRALLPFLFCASLQADERKPVSLSTVTLSRTQDALLINGTLVADRAARLSAAVSGLVSRLYVDIGDRVEAGAPLIELDAELIRLALQQARADFQQQQAALDDARRRLEEANSLVARRSIAASEVRSLESEVRVATSALASSQAEVARQQALLKRHTVRAPFAGAISAKLTESGEWLTPGTAVLELVSSNHLHADFAVPQQYFRHLSHDTALDVWLEGQDSDAAPSLQGAISAIVPVNDPTARTFTVRASITGSGLTPGMAIKGQLRILSGDPHPVIPRDALLRDSQGNVSVWVARYRSEGLTVQRKTIKVRPGQADQVTVLDGLRQGERVVVRGNEGLRDGDRIRVVD